MLESLHRRSRGRNLAKLLTAALSAPPPAVGVPINFHHRSIGGDGPGAGEVARALIGRLSPDQLPDLEARLDDTTRPLWEEADEGQRPYLTLAFALHHSVPGVPEATGLYADEPPEGVHAMARGPLSVGGSYYYADLIAEGLAAAGAELAPGVAALDFGCSSGRVVRVLKAFAPDVNWYGCDPIADAVTWASEHVRGVTFDVSPERPPLAYADESLDFVYAISIWSHFSLRAARVWLREMKRILKPGGVLLITTQGWHSTHYYAVTGAWAESGLARTVAELYDAGASFTAVFGPGGDFGVDNADWGMGFQSPEWLLNEMTPEFQVAYYRPGRVERTRT